MTLQRAVAFFLAVLLSFAPHQAVADSVASASVSVHQPLAPHFSSALIDSSEISQITWPSWGRKDLLPPKPRPVPNAPTAITPSYSPDTGSVSPDTGPVMQSQPVPVVGQMPLDNAAPSSPQPQSTTDKIEKDVTAWGTKTFTNQNDKATHNPNLPRTANEVGGPMAYNAKPNPSPQDIYSQPHPRENLGPNPSVRKRAENWFDNLFGMPGDNQEGRKDMPRTRAATGTPGTYSPRSPVSAR